MREEGGIASRLCGSLLAASRRSRAGELRNWPSIRKSIVSGCERSYKSKWLELPSVEGAYSLQNQQTSIYDCAGQRVQTTANGTTRKMVYDIFGQNAADYANGVLERENIYRGGQLLATADMTANLALNKTATQSSDSGWVARHDRLRCCASHRLRARQFSLRSQVFSAQA